MTYSIRSIKLVNSFHTVLTAKTDFSKDADEPLA